jgi:hypothetical protein
MAKELKAMVDHGDNGHLCTVDEEELVVVHVHLKIIQYLADKI